MGEEDVPQVAVHAGSRRFFAVTADDALKLCRSPSAWPISWRMTYVSNSPIRSLGIGSFCARGSTALACVKYQVSISFSTSCQSKVWEEITSPLRGSTTAAPNALRRPLGVHRITL